MKRFIWWLSIALVIMVVSIPAIIFFLPLPPLFSDISYSRSVFDDKHHLLRLTLSRDQQYRLPISVNDSKTLLPAYSTLVEATLLQEDQYFYHHPGVNPVSLTRAAMQTYLTGNRRFGASTITMQVARLRYGMQSKTLTGKVEQIVRALQLEMHYSKNQLLAAYLDLAPYGNNIQGVSAASLLYFGKSVNELSLPEILALAVIPQNPIKRTPDRTILQTARAALFQRWIAKHPADSNQLALINLPLQMQSLHAAPFGAPHLVNELLAAHPDQLSINTTLDGQLQRTVERITQQYVARKSGVGIKNAAVMIVDTRTMETKVLVGSANFYNTAIAGQIDGTLSKRSPGSTLKPFIYALAIDQGLIHPDTMLKDVPHSFGSYNPENFDNDFNGPIKAKDALILSRNIPAVTLAAALKQPSLYEFLQQANITHLKPEKYYGLALVLGGAEVSMQDLTALYATLANRGVWRPIKFIQHESADKGKKLLSPEASYLVLDMLQETERPQGFAVNDKNSNEMIAWKTGTSSGYRDAWTEGVVGPYVVSVWLGNFNNQGNPALIGKEMAAPLFFEIITALRQHSRLTSTAPNPATLNLTKVEVCKVSGMLPNPHCPETEKTWFIPGKSPIAVDTIHREVAINPRTGLRACQFDQHTQFAVYEFWPSDLLALFKRAGLQRRSPPAPDTSCTLTSKVGEGFSPQITSPQSDITYVARLADRKVQLPLTAIVDGDVKNLYWFMNETYLGKTSRDKTFFLSALPGKYVIRVVDDYGRSDGKVVNILLNS